MYGFSTYLLRLIMYYETYFLYDSNDTTDFEWVVAVLLETLVRGHFSGLVCAFQWYECYADSRNCHQESKNAMWL